MEYGYESRAELNKRYANSLLPLTITFGIMALIGIVGNIIVLIVYSLGREYRNNNFRIFVLCLGVIDLLTSAFLIPAEMAKHRNYFSFESIALCKVKCLFNVWAGCSAALALLIISIDRFRKVCQPLKKQISTKLALRLCIIMSFVVPLVLSTPGAIMCGIKEENKTNIYGNNTLVYLCATEPVYENHFLRYIYKYTFVILLVGVSVSCIIMYILIGRQIIKHWGSVPASFRKDSGKDLNSDYSSDTFGKLNQSKKSIDRTASSASDSQSKTNPPPSPIVKESLSRTSSNDSTKRPPLKKQASSFEADRKSEKRLIKQISNISFSSLGKSSGKSSDDAASRRRTFSRQASAFGMRQFPYKTLIWLILTLVFVITYIFYLILAIKVPLSYHMDPQEFTVFTSFYRIYFVNNIINPVIYALLDRKFRKSCRNLCTSIKARLKN